MLMKLGEHERDVNSSMGKFFAFRKAVTALSTMTTRVRSGKEAQKLPGIGPKIAVKIDEYLQGGDDAIMPSKDTKTSNGSASVTDTSNCGNLKISQVYEKLLLSKLEATRMQLNQINTIADLREKTNLLTKPQIICLEYFDDLCKPISREEIHTIGKQIKKIVRKVSEHLIAKVCGSYRRGAIESDRIDILLVHSEMNSTKIQPSAASSLLANTLAEVVKALEKDGLLKKRLLLGNDNFIGLAQLKHSTPLRRISLHLVSNDQLVCGLFYLTGSDTFCEQITQHALNAGYILDKNNLRKLGYTCVAGQPISLDNENDLFEFIQHQFVKPEERNS